MVDKTQGRKFMSIELVLLSDCLYTQRALIRNRGRTRYIVVR